jgi:hypothetical protein
MKAGTPNHIKAQRLKRRLKIPLYQVVGLLEMLWQVASHSSWKGDIGHLSDEDIAAALEWEGDPSELINALHQAGWLDADKTCRYRIHDWHDHAPEYIKKKLRAAGIEAPCRDSDETISRQVGDISLLTLPCHANPNHAKQKTPTESSAEVFRFKTIGQPDTWTLLQSQVDRWLEIYPGLDVVGECRKALGWTEANQLKTAKGMKRFLNRWLVKAADQIRAPQRTSGTRLPTDEERADWKP